YIVGPNYNKPWELFDEREIALTLSESRQSCAAARSKMAGASDVEQALIAALEHRYQSDQPAANLYAWSAEYAEAMREVYDRFNDDPDVITLFAEALMNRTPWNMWDPRSGKPVEGADTLECQAVLERGIQLNRDAGRAPHPGMWHLFVHLME